MEVKEMALNEFKETEIGGQRYGTYYLLVYITMGLGLINILLLSLKLLNVYKLPSIAVIILLFAFLQMLFIIWDYYEVKILKVALEDYERRH